MTALQAPRLTKEKLTAKGRRYGVAAGVVIWQGAMVALKTVAGVTSAQAAATAAGLTVVGVATGTADNRTGVAGALNVDAEIGVFLMNVSATDPVTAANIGATVYAVDDNTVSATNGGGTQSAAGVLWDIDAATGLAWVKFS
jgi:hypothetical protein